MDDIESILGNINTLLSINSSDFRLLLAWNVFHTCLKLIFGKHSKYSVIFLHKLLEIIQNSNALLLLEKYVNYNKQNQAEPDDYYSRQLLNRLLRDWNKLKSIHTPEIYGNIISLIVTTHMDLSEIENENSLEIYDDFTVPAMLTIKIPIIDYIIAELVHEDFLEQSIEHWMLTFLEYDIKKKHITVFKYFIDKYGYVPDVDVLITFLEFLDSGDSLLPILELLLQHSEDGFIMRNEEEFINQIIYNNEGTKNYSINVINILIKDYIQRKINRDNVQIDKFIKLALKEKSTRLLETVIEFMYEYDLFNESLAMDVFRFVIEKANVKLLRKVYYLFIQHLGVNLNEEQRIELFDLAGQQDNTKVLKFLHDMFIEDTDTAKRRKHYLDTALVSAARSAAPKRRRHLPTIKYLLEQPEMNIIPHQAYQASSESSYPYLSDMFYQHNELLYRPDSGSEYRVALDRFNARLNR